MKYKYIQQQQPARLFPKGSPQQIDPRILTITRGCPSFELGPALESTLAYNTLRVRLCFLPETNREPFTCKANELTTIPGPQKLALNFCGGC